MCLEPKLTYPTDPKFFMTIIFFDPKLYWTNIFLSKTAFVVAVIVVVVIVDVVFVFVVVLDVDIVVKATLKVGFWNQQQ